MDNDSMLIGQTPPVRLPPMRAYMVQRDGVEQQVCAHTMEFQDGILYFITLFINAEGAAAGAITHVFKSWDDCTELLPTHSGFIQ